MQRKRLYIADLLLGNLDKKEIAAEIRRKTALRLLEIRREKKKIAQEVNKISQLRCQPVRKAGHLLHTAIKEVQNV